MSKGSLFSRFVMDKHADGKQYLHDTETGQAAESEEGIVPPTAMLLFNALAADLAEIRERLDALLPSADRGTKEGDVP